VAGSLGNFYQGAVDAVCVEVDGRQRPNAPPPALLVAGAFNPLHAGHWGIALAATRLLGKAGSFELCIANVDKSPLSALEVDQRLRQFAWRAPVWVTRAPTFVEKARLFAGTVFAVGADTAARIVAPRYYAQAEIGLAQAMDEIRLHGCRFLVACRVDASGNCIGLEDLPLPTAYRDLFVPIPRAEFRLDISSTVLRKRFSD
jgi:hypothetical protein